MTVEQDPNVASASRRVIALVGRSGGAEPIAAPVLSRGRTQIDFGECRVDVIQDRDAAVTGVRVEINDGRLGQFREKSGGNRGSADPVTSAANKIRKVCKDSKSVKSAKTRLVARRRELVSMLREALPDLAMAASLDRRIEDEQYGLELSPKDRWDSLKGPLSITLVCEGERFDRYHERVASRDYIDIQLRIDWEGVDLDKAIEKLRAMLPLVAALPQFEDDTEEESDEDGEPIDAEWDDDEDESDEGSYKHDMDAEAEADAIAQGDCDAPEDEESEDE